LPSTWTALSPGADVHAEARRVAVAREEFLSTGRVAPSLRCLVVDSWRRSLAEGADPGSGPRVVMTSDEVTECRRTHPLAVAMPVVRRLLLEDAADTGLVVGVTDAAGRLLWVEGDSGHRRRAEHIGTVEGALWSEKAVGTNAPGTALALDHAVQIFAAEHLAAPVISWGCSAAPVHAPDGTVLGTVGLTSTYETTAPHHLTLARSVSAAVEAELRLRQLSERTARAGTGSLDRPRRRPASTAGLRLLGRATGELVTPRGTTPLRLRHSEILLVLTLNPAGLTSERLDVELHHRRTAPVTLRAEMCRLRDLLARDGTVSLASRPYRISGQLDSDVAEVRRLLHAGNYKRALDAYPGPLLPDSVAPGVEAVRERLRRELRSCLLAKCDADLLLRFGESGDGREDLDIWEACLRTLPPSSPRVPVVAARVRQLNEELL
jgi:hypothetical protein